MRGAQQRGLGGAGDKPVDANGFGLHRPARHEIAHAQGIARFGEIGIVAGGEHAHRQQFQPRAFRARDGGAHRLRIGMDREQIGAEPGDLRRRMFDGVGDVVQLEIDEHMLAGSDEPLSQRQTAAAVDQLHADLIKCDAVVEGFHPTLRRSDVGRVERDDQALARMGLVGQRHVSELLRRGAGKAGGRPPACAAPLLSEYGASWRARGQRSARP